MSYLRKFPTFPLVIFLLFGLASRAYGDDKDPGRRETPARVLRPTPVYSQPREGSRQIATIKAGREVQIVDDQGDWLEIRSKHGRPPGFIKKDAVITKRKSPEPVLHGQAVRPKKTSTGGEGRGAEPKVRITSPKDGSRLIQDKDIVLVTGKVSTEGAATPNVDIYFVLDVSGSTARYAGVDFGDSELPPVSSQRGRAGGGIRIFGGGFGMGGPVTMDLRNSILAAEVAATRRLLSQLNPETTRVGLVTFGEKAQVLEPLTHDFEQVKESLDDVFLTGPYGGTHMVGGIRLAIRELSGLGQSQSRRNAVKVQLLLTDGFPTLPIGGGKRAAPEDTRLAINAARIAGKAGIKIHVFALGEEALSSPRAAVGIAEKSGGIFTPVVRPADILAVLESISVIGVDAVEVFNETTGERASHLRLAADGFFSSALPMVEGLNRIRALARTSSGATVKDSISVFYQPGTQRSLDLEVFLEKEKSLKLEVERLGKKREEIQREIDRSRKESLGRSDEPPRAAEQNLQP